METYITPELVLVDMDEDVITASALRCESYTVNTSDGYIIGYTVYFSDGTSQDYSYYPTDLCG